MISALYSLTQPGILLAASQKDAHRLSKVAQRKQHHHKQKENYLLFHFYFTNIQEKSSNIIRRISRRELNTDQQAAVGWNTVFIIIHGNPVPRGS